MKLNTFKQSFLQSGNIRQDARVEFLIGAVGGNIDSLLDTKGNINCTKINHAINENTFKLSDGVLAQVKSTLSRVRNTFSYQARVSLEIYTCDTYDEMINVFKSHRKSLNINTFILNKVLAKAESLDKALKVISRYGKGLELNIESMNILFKLSNGFKEKKDLLETYWKGKELDIYMLNMLLEHAINIETYMYIITSYGGNLGPKATPTTMILLLRNVLRIENHSERRKNIPEVLKLFNTLDLTLSDVDKFSLGRLLSSNKAYYKFILKSIRQNNVTQLYFLLPEQKA